MKADVRLIRTTFFRNKSAATLTARDMSLEELRELTLGTNEDIKDDLPLLKLATFGDKRSDKGSLRHNANVVSMSGIEADYDGEVMPFEEATKILEAARLSALLYTSPSHTKDKPRWRVLCRTSRDLPPGERAKLVARLNGIFDGVFAPESFALSQSYYYGSVKRNAAHRAVIVAGDCIDLRDDLDASAIGNVFNNEHQPNEKLAADDLEELAAAVAAIPNDIQDYCGWKNFGMAIYSATEGEGFKIFGDFSRRWIGGDYNEAHTQKAWRQIDRSPPKRIGAGTIYHMANKASPGWRRQYETERIAKIFAERKEERKEAADDPTAKPRISATPFAWIDPEKIPQRQWLYRPHYIRKFESATISTGGVGKSSLVIAEALAMATGKSLLGVQPEQQLRVWYWNGEDPTDELQRRFAAAAMHHKLTPDDIGDRLFVDSGRTMPIVIAEGTQSGASIAVPVINDVIATLLDNKIDVLIIDPFVGCHRVPENDNSGIDRVAKSWSQIADAANCSIMLVHHSRKTYGNEMTVEDGRGASALIAATRTARVLNTMNKDDAQNLAIDAAERRRFFRSDIGKANLTRPAEQADWFTIKSVRLGNDQFGMGGDEVGVVERWVIPDDVHTGVDAEGIRKIQAVLREGGPWREDPRSQVEQWAGEAFAEALDLDITRKLVKNWITKGLRRLTKTGHLKRVIGPDRNREKRAYIEAGTQPADDAEVQF
jgi:hypothetical protein